MTMMSLEVDSNMAFLVKGQAEFFASCKTPNCEGHEHHFDFEVVVIAEFVIAAERYAIEWAEEQVDKEVTTTCRTIVRIIESDNDCELSEDDNYSSGVVEPPEEADWS